MKALAFRVPVESPLPDHPSDPAIMAQVATLLTKLFPRGQLVERRSHQRYPFPYLVRLIRIGSDGSTPTTQSIVVVGKHISEAGLGFYHVQPLVDRRMIASFETSCGQRIAFLIDIHWCRFTKEGWYESGGRFLRTLPSPEEPPPGSEEEDKTPWDLSPKR